jgi:hypothetical protein
MTKEDKGKKKYTHEKRHQHTFVRKRVEQNEPIGNDNMATPINKKLKS